VSVGAVFFLVSAPPPPAEPETPPTLFD
jgi:hypothetical protein